MKKGDYCRYILNNYLLVKCLEEPCDIRSFQCEVYFSDGTTKIHNLSRYFLDETELTEEDECLLALINLQ